MELNIDYESDIAGLCIEDRNYGLRKYINLTEFCTIQSLPE